MTFTAFVVLLSAVSGYVLGSTLKPDVEVMNTEDSVLYIMNQMRTMEERLLILESRESTFTNRLSEMEKATKLSLSEMSERLLVEKNKLLVMDNHLLFEVHELQKRSLETHIKITKVENEVRNVSEGGRTKADLLEVRLNETVGLVTSCLASQRETEESVQKNLETLEKHVNEDLVPRLENLETLEKHVNEDLVPRLENVHSDITDRIGSVENSLGKLRNECANFSQVSDQQKTDFKLAVENYTTEVSQMKQELSRFQSICSPPCENGGQCVKNVCQCTGFFAGDRCQEAVCSPPCDNGGQCLKNNTCNCTRFFMGDRCQHVTCDPPCENGGQCLENNVCQCTPSFTGYRCQDAVCNPPCRNGGRCMVNNVCQCTPSFIGDRCQDAACSPPCKNGGQCMNGNVCKCTSLFHGDRCQDWQCGVEINNGGGNNNKTLVWPWLAALYNRNNMSQFLCAGSVIHRHFVLTSGYCASAYSYRFAVKLGLTDFKNRTHLQEYFVSSVHIHPQYKYGATSYDIALLKLEKPIEYNNFVRPICLPLKEVPHHNQFYKSQSSVKGVIDLYSYMTQSSNIVKDVDLIIQPPEVCRNKAPDIQRYYPSPGLVFCAGGDACYSLTSGSPLIQSHLAGDGTRFWTQVGVGVWCPYGNHLFSSRYQNIMPWVNATMEAALKK